MYMGSTRAPCASRLRNLLGTARTAGALALWLLPGVALADNCSSLSDCYYTAQAAVAATTGLALLGILLSTTLDFIPFVGTAKGAYEAITGRDAVTGQELEWWERALGIVPFGGALLGAGAVGLKALDRSADLADAAGDIARGLDRAGDATRAADRTGEVVASRAPAAYGPAASCSSSGVAPWLGRHPVSGAGA